MLIKEVCFVFFEGKLSGTIANSEKGKGWGFDPIFIPKNAKKTFGELIEKNNLSHRYKAFLFLTNSLHNLYWSELSTWTAKYSAASKYLNLEDFLSGAHIIKAGSNEIDEKL